MSPGRLVPWAEAYALALYASEHLTPHVVRLKAVGSIRRRREYVGDLEFLVEPRMVTAPDLFDPKNEPELGPLREQLVQLGRWLQGGERQMAITDFNGRQGLRLELYICWSPASWGTLLAIRTGPVDLSRAAVTRLHAHGRRSEHGRVIDSGGHEVPTPTEEHFFAAAGLPCVPPRARDALVAKLNNSARFSSTGRSRQRNLGKRSPTTKRRERETSSRGRA